MIEQGETVVLIRNCERWPMACIEIRKFDFFSVGKPIQVERCPRPSQQDIDDLHAAYLQRLKELYTKYNPIFGRTGDTLQFI